MPPSVTWVVQTNLGSSEDVGRIRRSCEALGHPFLGVTAVPFSDELPAIAVTGPAVAYGSTRLTRKLHAARLLRPGVFFDDALFRYSRWAEAIRGRALNAGAAVTTLRALAAEPRPDGEPVFVRPDDDAKDFAGQVLPFGELRRWAEALSPGGFELSVDAPIVAARPVDIDVEWRLFVVDGRVSTGSRYRSGGASDVRPELPGSVIAFAHEVTALFQPAPVFVLDVAAVGDRLAVIEFNGFHSAGFYASDVERIVRDVSGAAARAFTG